MGTCGVTPIIITKTVNALIPPIEAGIPEKNRYSSDFLIKRKKPKINIRNRAPKIKFSGNFIEAAEFDVLLNSNKNPINNNPNAIKKLSAYPQGFCHNFLMVLLISQFFLNKID
jgi:hypothetical protein